MKNKVIIITGSTQGIGFETAKQLALKGATIVLNGRNEEKLEMALHTFRDKGLSATAIRGDVSSFEDCQKIIEHTIKNHGQIDYLINNAGTSSELTPLENLSPKVFKKVMEVNVLGPANLTIAALPHIRKQKGGILFISSLAGIFGLPEASPYSASKMSLTALAESLKLEMAGSGVSIGIAYLGFVENDSRKTILSKDGATLPQPKHGFTNPEPVEVVAGRIIKMLEKGTFKKYFTPIGKAFYFMNRLSPKLLEIIMLRIYRKRKENIEV